jgi:AcrR family transcriptional regulator
MRNAERTQPLYAIRSGWVTHVINGNICSVPPRTRYHHGNLRRALLSAARSNVAAQREDWSLRDIAKDVGVSSAAPYRHFRDRQALLLGVAVDIAEDLAALLDATSEQCRGRSRFLVMARAYVEFATERAPEFRTCLTAQRIGAESKSGGAPDASDAEHVLAPVWRKLATAWTEFARAGRPRFSAARSLIHGAAVLAASGEAPGDLDDSLTRLAC